MFLFAISLILSLILSVSSANPILAVPEFTTNQDIVYAIDLQGNAFVTHEISLTNNFSGIYAKEYVIQLSDVFLNNITASDIQGNILKKTESVDKNTKIYVKFNDPAIGKDKTQKFKLTYDISNFVTNKGKQKELTLPTYQTADKLTNSTIKLPLSFGTLAFASINPSSQQQTTDQIIIKYQELSSDKKIMLAFGDSQIFDFQLQYHLTSSSQDTNKEIPIPPDTSTQQIILQDISPPPLNIKSDTDGNWLAQYFLPAGTSLDVKIEGQAKILSRPSTEQAEPQHLKQLVSASNYWPTQDPLIQNLLPNLKTPKDIYDYVIQMLDYNYSQINNASRKGALLALTDPTNSLCTEFTDLFVTLARAKNIPAREIEGFAYTNNPKIKPLNTNADVLHAWPQYWDSQKSAWISIDPTWGKTTNGIDFFNDLDLNHFTFVIHGLKSDYPPPPGSFRDGSDQKTVNVSFAAKEISPVYNRPLLSTVKTNINQKTKIKIKNPNPNSLKNLHLNSPALNWTYSLPVLPPLSETTIEVPRPSFLQSLMPSNHQIKLNITYDYAPNQIFHQVTNLYHYLNLAIAAAVLIVVLSLGGIIITSKTFHA